MKYTNTKSVDETPILLDQTEEPTETVVIKEATIKEKPFEKAAIRKVNVRQTASLSAPVVRVLDKDQLVTILGEDSEWCQIKDGYVKKEFLI